MVLFNRACCKSGWPQEGIYLSINPDLSDPGNWTRPIKIMDAKQIGFSPGYYPQVVSTDPGGTDTLAGKFARLYIKGISKWGIEFLTSDELASMPPPAIEPDPPIDVGIIYTIGASTRRQ